jgi:hypothetical protein
MAFQSGVPMKRSSAVLWAMMAILTIGSLGAVAQRQPAPMTIEVHKSPT